MKRSSKSRAKKPTVRRTKAAHRERKQRRYEQVVKRIAVELRELDRYDIAEVVSPEARRHVTEPRRAVVVGYLADLLELAGVDPKVTPVPNGLDVQQKQFLFLELLREFGSVGVARRPLGVSREDILAWSNEDAAWKQRMQYAVEESVDELELEAQRRAVYGVPSLGKSGAFTHYSDSLLTMLLKSKRFPDQLRVASPPGQSLNVNNTGERPESRDDIIRSLLSLVVPKKDPR